MPTTNPNIANTVPIPDDQMTTLLQSCWFYRNGVK